MVPLKDLKESNLVDVIKFAIIFFFMRIHVTCCEISKKTSTWSECASPQRRNDSNTVQLSLSDDHDEVQASNERPYVVCCETDSYDAPRDDHH